MLLVSLLACAVATAVDAPVEIAPALEQAPVASTLREAFPPPVGSTRVAGGAFGEWLGQLPLQPAGYPVHDYRGNVTDLPGARVLAWSAAGQTNLQCADFALRLRATWEREVGRSPAFHYTSGDLSRWSDWAAGTRPRVSGNKVTFLTHAARADGGDAAFSAWLANLYTYAGTQSLGRDTVAADLPHPGDLLVTPGSPGHAVVLLDVATDQEHTWVLVGQGFLPAVEFHVIAGPEAGWYRVGGPVLDTRPIPMAWAGLRRWKDE